MNEEQQAILLEAAKEVEVRNWERAREEAERNKEILAEHGVTVVPADPDLVVALQKAAQSVVDNWLSKTGDVGRSILDAYRNE